MIVSNRLWDWWSKKTGYIGITIFPFIILDSRFKDDEVLINHEKIHIAQQKELLVVGFFILYVGHYLWNLAKYKTHFMAYEEIFFEVEAYRMQDDPDYLSKRERFASFDHFLE